MNQTLFTQKFERTLDQLLGKYADGQHQGYQLEAWLFEDEANRREAEERFAAAGVMARLRSAYKPLVHAFLEEISLEQVESVAIRYPMLELQPRRFLLEAYPLAALLSHVRLSWEATDRPDFSHEVILTLADGTTRHQIVEAPNRYHQDHIFTTQLSPCGWLCVMSATGEVITDTAIQTDYEALFQSIMNHVMSHPWGDQIPLFEELNLSVTLPGADTKLAYDHEAISLHEALHEEIYFSLLEYFQHRAGLPLGDRSLMPGQIVPEITAAPGDPTLTISLRPLNAEVIERPPVDLNLAPQALGVKQIIQTLEQFRGEHFTAPTRSGRTVQAVYHPGSDAAVMISAAQHANETSGIVGALRAATELAKRDTAHFVISPLENPDGYAMQGRLIATQPTHMHHAARYTAFGNDLQNQLPGSGYELSIREQASALSHAGLHLNLHGYPAHEWTRPLTGYIPRGFEMWTIPKGFFLILRHQNGWLEKGTELLHAVTKKLAQVPGLVEFNRRQIELFEIHAGELIFPMINGFPCLISEDNQQLTPLMLITEYPDETLHDEAFIQAHTAQKATVLAAYDAWQQMNN